MRFTSFFFLGTTSSAFFFHKTFLSSHFLNSFNRPSNHLHCSSHEPSKPKMTFFPDERFESCVKGLTIPNLQGWDFVAECESLKIYKQLATVSSNKGLYKYKVIGVLKGIEATIAHSVYMDLDYRRQWDNLTSDQLRVRPLPPQFSDIPDLECIYWRVNLPMLLSDRDYVFLRQSKTVKTEDDCPCYVVAAEAYSKSVEPPVKGVVRVAEYTQTILFAPGKEDDKEEYFDNPGGNIPSAVINWAVSSGVPTFLSKLKNACHRYSSSSPEPVVAEKKEVQELRNVIDESLKTSFQL